MITREMNMRAIGETLKLLGGEPLMTLAAALYDALDRAETVGFQEGVEEGFHSNGDGFNAGYEDGYDDGFDDGLTSEAVDVSDDLLAEAEHEAAMDRLIEARQTDTGDACDCEMCNAFDEPYLTDAEWEAACKSAAQARGE